MHAIDILSKSCSQTDSIPVDQFGEGFEGIRFPGGTASKAEERTRGTDAYSARRDRLIVMSQGSRVARGGKQTNKPSMSTYKSPLVA